VEPDQNAIISAWSNKYDHRIRVFNGMSRNEANSQTPGLIRIVGIYSTKSFRL